MQRLLIILVVLTIGTSIHAIRLEWEPQWDRFVLIHADDAGLCASANRATIAAMETGVVSSASIMVPCPGFEEFAEYARSHPEQDFGVHLTFTSEWSDFRWGPVSNPADIPSLVSADGTFWRSAAQFAEHAVLQEVELEMRAQIDLARKREIHLSHLDCHMNSLFRRPDLLRLYVRISGEAGLPMRYAKRLPKGWDRVLPKKVVDEFYTQLKVLYSQGNPLADHVEHENYGVRAEDKRNYFLNVLRNLEPGVTELVVHCCDTTSGDWTPPDSAGRQADTDICCSPEFAHELDALGIRVINWKDFVRLTEAE